MNLCSICARGGSKGVKNKNLRELMGKPLIAHSIEQAKAAGIFTKIAVSSDSQEILDVAKKYGADFIISRPEELATDTAAKLPVIQHCAQMSEELLGDKFQYIVDIDTTSPLRSVDDLVKSLENFKASSADNLITAAPARRSPYFNMVKRLGDRVELVSSLHTDVVRRQDALDVYDMNASIYIWTRESLMNAKKVIGENTMLFEMPEQRSLDVDSELDFALVKFIMENKLNV